MKGTPIRVVVDEHLQPSVVDANLVECLKRRWIAPQFLYESRAQIQKWLTLHEAYSPARTDSCLLASYQQAFKAVAESFLQGKQVHLFGLSCGGAQKEEQFLEILSRSGKKVVFSALDVSLPLALEACRRAARIIGAEACLPALVELESSVRPLVAQLCRPDHIPFFTFFGTFHNFEPQRIVERLRSTLAGSEMLLLSANLAPAENYDYLLGELLKGYDNELARDWLWQFLLEAGFKRSDGEIQFSIEPSPEDPRLKRFVAYFRTQTECELKLYGKSIPFAAGEQLRLFFSYRYSQELLEEVLKHAGLKILGKWIPDSEEEGIYLVQRSH